MPDAVHLGSGKVRELYALDDERLLLVASDRISTFDVVLPTAIPDKGRVLTGLAAFWFARTRSICANHLLALRPDGRSTECRRLEMLPIECVVRGYLSGSGWKEYRQTGKVCGHRLPAGLRESDRLPEPIFTPATKAETGHDENITREQAAADRRGRALRPGRAALDRALPVRRRLRARARHHHRRHQVRVRRRPGRAGSCWSTRRSPRTRRASGRPTSTRPAGPQPSFDKQFVRDFCEKIGWDKTYPGPELPDDVVAGTRRRYVEAFEHLTAIRFDDYLANPSVVLA